MGFCFVFILLQESYKRIQLVDKYVVGYNERVDKKKDWDETSCNIDVNDTSSFKKWKKFVFLN